MSTHAHQWRNWIIFPKPAYTEATKIRGDFSLSASWQGGMPPLNPQKNRPC